MAKPVDVTPELKLFDDIYRDKYGFVAGIDEAGRGPLAGPVVCACVMFDEDIIIPYVNDSKKLSPKRRDILYEEIKNSAKSVGIGIADNELIDKINILNATKYAMSCAVNSMEAVPDILLIDAVEIDTKIPQVSLIKGDTKSFSIAAASIIAKVTRDRIMLEYDLEYPGYGFSSHKGYGTRVHYEALNNLGPCKIHRKTFLH